MIKITTNRLLIRDHIKTDLEPMHKLLSNQDTMFYLSDIMTTDLEGTKKDLQIAIKEANSPDRKKYFFAIIDKNNHDYIGEIGFTKTKDTENGSIVHLGYFISEKYWGKGIVTEATKAVITYAFKNLNVCKIETGCAVENKASENIMKKLGMVKSTELKDHTRIGSKLYDRVEYHVFKDEWKANVKNKCISVEAEYILKKDNVNWETIDDWIEKGLQRNKNVKLEYFTTISSKLIDKYAKVLEEIENAMPTEIEEPYYNVSASDLRKEEKELEDSEKKILSCIAIDENGNIIGINRVFIKNNDQISIRQWQIGVVKSYQGKSIAKWLKADMYRKLLDEYPELESIGSDTHPSNIRMIKIMESIGFKYLHTTREYENSKN